MAILSKLMYRFNTVPIRTRGDIFVETDKLFLKSIWLCKGLRKKQNNPEIFVIVTKKNKLGRLMLPSFKTYYKTMIIKTLW